MNFGFKIINNILMLPKFIKPGFKHVNFNLSKYKNGCYYYEWEIDNHHPQHHGTTVSDTAHTHSLPRAQPLGGWWGRGPHPPPKKKVGRTTQLFTYHPYFVLYNNLNQ